MLGGDDMDRAAFAARACGWLAAVSAVLFVAAVIALILR